MNPESIVIKKNGEILKDTVIDSSDTGFVIRTGTGLSDRDTMEVAMRCSLNWKLTEHRRSETVQEPAEIFPGKSLTKMKLP